MAWKVVYFYLSVLLTVSTSGENVRRPSLETPRRVEDGRVSLDVAVRRVLAEQLAGCQLSLVTTIPQSPHASRLAKVVSGIGKTSILVVELESLFSQDEVDRSLLLQSLWLDPNVLCHGFLLCVTNGSLAIRFLEESGLWRHPQTSIVLVGGNDGVNEEEVLLHSSLRNSIQVLYLLPVDVSRQPTRPFLLKKGGGGGGGGFDEKWQEEVKILGRCLYCGEEHGPALLSRSKAPPNTLFPWLTRDLNGRLLRVAMLPYFPLSDNEKNIEEDGSVLLRPRDSLDVRIINALANLLNFTYELVEPPDGQWGVVDDRGNWSGVVGMMQGERADLSFCLTITAPRLPIMDYSRIYTNDPLVIISLVPKPLPRFLALVRPLAGELWGILAFSILGWGVISWLLQRMWSWVSGNPPVNVDYALLYSWGAMMNNPPSNLALNVVERVLLGWWLLFCLVITTGYRSSLVAHLTVQSKSAPINSFQDLLDRDGWAWGSLKSFRMSAYVQIFQKTPDETLRKMYEKVEIREVDEGLELVLRGGYSFISGKYYIRSIIAMSYTDARGYTPLYTSRKEYTLWAGFIWAFRKGAPFSRDVSLAKQRMLEAGLVDYWTNEVMDTRIQNDKKQRGRQTTNIYVIDEADAERQVVLGLQHLLSAFLILFLGSCLASFSLLLERLFHCQRPLTSDLTSPQR